MTLKEVCPECSGNVEIQQIADWRDWVCLDCASVIDSKNLKLEEQQKVEPKENYEVEEL